MINDKYVEIQNENFYFVCDRKSLINWQSFSLMRNGFFMNYAYNDAATKTWQNHENWENWIHVFFQMHALDIVDSTT